MAKKKVSITLDEDVLIWIDEAAGGLGMSRSEFINFVFSGGRDAKLIEIDKIVDQWYFQKKAEIDQKKAEMMAKLEE